MYIRIIYLFWLLLRAFYNTKLPNLFFISSKLISSLHKALMNFEQVVSLVSKMHFSTTLEEYL